MPMRTQGYKHDSSKSHICLFLEHRGRRRTLSHRRLERRFLRRQCAGPHGRTAVRRRVAQHRHHGCRGGTARRAASAFRLLLRFQDVLRARVQRLNLAFAEAISEMQATRTVYQAVYPIKVNQLHEVVEEVLDAGKPYGLGLECGSKAELIATLAHLESDDTLLICNGVKDRVDAVADIVESATRQERHSGDGEIRRVRGTDRAGRCGREQDAVRCARSACAPPVPASGRTLAATSRSLAFLCRN